MLFKRLRQTNASVCSIATSIAQGKEITMLALNSVQMVQTHITSQQKMHKTELKKSKFLSNLILSPCTHHV